MTKRLAFRLAGVASLLALLTRPALAQEVPTMPTETPAAAPVGALLAPADTVATIPQADSTAPAPFIGPMMPAGMLGATPAPAVPAVDTLVLNRSKRIPARLRTLERTIPLVYNPYVRGFIDYFTIRNPKYTRRMLERQPRYFPMFEQYLAKYGLPAELKYLSVVESALNARASSKALAVGLWQFIPEAARDYKLVINSWKDERMDPEKATDAACRYLRNLNRAFNGDWELALAAYNCGPGNVRRAIKKAGGKANFWSIFPYLPQETRGYVPSFTAVVYAMNYAGEYGIQADNLQFPFSTDTVQVTGGLDLSKFAAALGLEAGAIHELNTELRRPLLPAVPGGYTLRIPTASRLAFDAVNRTELLAQCQPTPAATVALALDSVKNANKTRYVSSRYVVRHGETLQRVASKNGCTIAQLRTWNHLRSSHVKPGQGLLVWKAAKPKRIVVDDPSTIAQAKADSAARLNATASATSSTTTSAATPTEQPAENASAVTPKEAPAAPATVVAARPVPTPASTAAQAAVSGLSAAQLDSARGNGYTVDRGDNLFQIARAFNVPVRKLAEWNGLKENRLILGQTLVMRAPAAEALPQEAPAAPEADAVASAEVAPGGELAGTEFSTAPATSAHRTRAQRAQAAWAQQMRQKARVVHLVQPGDTLWNISKKRNVSVEQLRRLNKLKSDALKPGQKIVVS